MLVAHGSLNKIAEVPNRGFYCPLLDYSMTDEIINRKTSTLIIEKESWSSFSHDKKKIILSYSNLSFFSLFLICT